MTLPPQFDEPSSTQGPTGSDGVSPAGFVMRVHGGNHDGRLICVSADKCTIGRSPDCTIRLASPDFEPLHCLIVRGRGGIVVRCWSEGATKLNGEDFSVSWMVPGDRLGIGPIELELLESSGDGPPSGDSIASDMHAGDCLAAGEAELTPAADERTKSRQFLEQLLEERQELLERLGSLDLELKETRADRDHLRVAFNELKEEVASVVELRREWQIERETMERHLQELQSSTGAVHRPPVSWEDGSLQSNTHSKSAYDASSREETNESIDDDLVDMKAVLARYGVVSKDDELAPANKSSTLPGGLPGGSQPDLSADSSSTPGSKADVPNGPSKAPEELAKRRSSVPRINLSALRDVANQSARVAIDRAAHRNGLREAAVKWSISLIAIAIGWFVMKILSADMTVALVLSFACWTIAVWWLFLGSLVYRRAILTNPKRRQRAHETNPSTD